MRLEWGDRLVDGMKVASAVTYAEAEELGRLAEGAKAIEVGSAYGFSSVYIAKAANLLICVDPHDWMHSYEKFCGSLSRSNVWHKVVQVRHSSQEALPLLRSGGFDFIFIDGDHTELAVIHDVEQALRLLRPGGVLAVHDYGEDSCPDVKTALDEMGLTADRVVDTLFVTTKGKH